MGMITFSLKVVNSMLFVALNGKRNGIFPTLRLPCTIIIGCIFYAISIELLDHTIKGRLPKILKPVGLAEQLYECRAGCVIDADKGTTIPCF